MPQKKQVVKKAVQAKQKVVAQKTKKVRTSPIFRRPHTLRLPATSKLPSTTKLSTKKFAQYKILKYPLGTEHVLKKIEADNTLAFIVEKKSTKPNIKAAVESLYEVKVAKVNTLIRPDGEKKAYVRLAKGSDALETANKIGLV